MSGAIATAAILGGVGLAGGIGSAAIGAHAAGNAASEQSSAADRAAQLQYQASQNALAFQKQQWDTQQQNMAPWLSAGKGALGQLNYEMGLGPQNGTGANPADGAYGSLTAKNPYSVFTAPTGLTEQNDPGYQARLQLGTDALQKSAAARGGLLTGGFAQGLNQAAQDYALERVWQRLQPRFQHQRDQLQPVQPEPDECLQPACMASPERGRERRSSWGCFGQQASNAVGQNLMGTASAMGQDYQNAAAAMQRSEL